MLLFGVVMAFWIKLMLHGCAVMSCTIVHEQVFCLSILINTAIVCHGHLCKAYSCTIASWCVISFTMCWKLRISQPSFKATYQCYLSVLSRLVNLRILWFYDTMICSVVLLWYQQVLCYKTIMWCSLILWYNTNSTWCNDIYDKVLVLWYTALYNTA